MIRKAIGKLAIVLSPLVAWLGVGFLLYPSHLLKLAIQLEEEIDLPAIKPICNWVGTSCLIVAALFFLYWLRSREMTE